MTKASDVQRPTSKVSLVAAVVALAIMSTHAQDKSMNSLAEQYVRLVLAVG